MGFAFYDCLQVQKEAPALVCDAVVSIGCAQTDQAFNCPLKKDG